MSYSEGEALALAQVQAVSGFAASIGNTSRGKYGILNTGKAAVYAILRPGGFQRMWMAPKCVHTDYSTIVEVWQRYKDDGTTLTDLEANVQLILARLDLYRHMGDTQNKVLDAVAQASPEVMEMMTEDGRGPIWLKQEVTIVWKEESIVSPAE